MVVVVELVAEAVLTVEVPGGCRHWTRLFLSPECLLRGPHWNLARRLRHLGCFYVLRRVWMDLDVLCAAER